MEQLWPLCSSMLHNLFYSTQSKPQSLFHTITALEKCVYLVYFCLPLSVCVPGVRTAPVCFLVVSGSPGLRGTRIIFPL